MMFKGLVALFLVLGTASCIKYEIRGYINIISSYDIDPEYYDEQRYHEKQEEIVKRMSEIIGPNDFDDFIVHDYKIQGIDTPVFYASLSLSENSKLTRQDIIDKISATDDVQTYFLRKQDVNDNNASRFAIQKDDVTSCTNNGILFPNATCSCRPYNYGARCENVICRSNGIGENGRCACPPGAYSPHCEARKCIGNVQSAVDFSSQSLVFVINTRSSMAYDLTAIIENIPELLSDYQNQGIDITNYILTVYRTSKSVYFLESSTFDSSSDFVDYLSGIAIGPSTDDQPHLDALVSAQSTQVNIHGKSTIFLFADSENLLNPTPSPYLSTANESLVIQQTLSWRNKIVLVLSQWSNSPIVPTGNYFDVLRRVVAATHGDLFLIDKLEITDFLKNTFYYLISAPNTFVQYYNNQTKTIPIISDLPTTTTNILLTVESGQVPSINDKNGNPIKAAASGQRYAIYRTHQSETDTVTIVGDSIPLHNTRVFFLAVNDAVLVSYSSDQTVDNGNAYTFDKINQTSTVYSSFQQTTEVVVSRLDPFTSAIVQGAAVATARPNANCIFQFQAAAVPSCTPGPYVNNVQLTVNGAKIYRVTPGYCFSPDAHSAAPWSCLNNGTRSGTSACNCAANYQGLHCELPICQNGGTIDKFPNGNGHGSCICPFGVQGQFCETMICNATSQDVFESYNRSFAVVVQNSLSSSQALSQLNDGLRVMLQNGSSTDFEDFILTTFKNRKIGDEVSPLVFSTKYSSASGLLNAATSDNIEYTYSPTGAQPGLFALDTTLKSMTYDKSSIFFFTDSTSSLDSQSSNYSDIVQKAVERQIEISVVIIPPYGNNLLCSDTGLYEIYEILAGQTGGNFINLCQNYTTSGDPVLNFIASYGSTHHHTEVISYYNAIDCSNFNSDPFVISDINNDVYIVVYSPVLEKFTATVTDSGNSVQQPLVADSHSVPFFGSYQVKILNGSSLTYTLNIQSSSKSQCFIRVTERSQFSAYIGFSPDPSVDRYSRYITHATRQTPVVHLSSTLQSNPAIEITIKDPTNALLYRLDSAKRTSGCKYEYVMTKELTCHTAGDTFLMSTTIQTNEVTIQRTQRAYCRELDTCLNGGILLGGSCQCLPGYTLAHCEYPQCQNGGTVTDDYKCACPTGYDGNLCQYITCPDWNYVATHDPRESKFQQIVFVVEVNTKNMTLPDVYLQKNIDTFVQQSEDDNNPKQYTLITFDNQNVNVVVSTEHKTVFLNAFKKGVTVDVQTPSTVRSYDAILKAYDTIIENPGIVYLFTATQPEDVNVYSATQPKFGVQVNTFWFGGDYSTLKPTDVPQYLSAIARQSNGRILPISSLTTVSLINYLPQTISENQLVIDDAVQSCATGASFSFSLSSKTSSFVITATGAGVVLTLTDETGKQVNLASSATFTDRNAVVSTISTVNHGSGTWTATLTNTGSCFIQVRAITALEVILGFTNDKTQDFVSPTPRVGASTEVSTYITFRIVDSYNVDAINNGASVASVETHQTDISTPWSTTGLITNTTTYARDPIACASQFVTDLIPFTSGYEKFIIRGQDSVGWPYVRTYFFTRRASMTDCNGGSVDRYGFCICDANHFGNLCQFRRCQNGGISSVGLCDCPNGYYGDYCEQYVSV